MRDSKITCTSDNHLTIDGDPGSVVMWWLKRSGLVVVHHLQAINTQTYQT